jgi:hypothetical protein
MNKPRVTFDPKTSQYCAPVIIDADEPANTPWNVAYFDVDTGWNGGASVDVTEIVAPDGRQVDLAGLDVEWIEDQCRNALSDASRDDTLIYKQRAATKVG